MSAFRTGLLVTGCLILGFAAGWQLHHSPVPGPEIAPAIRPAATSAAATPQPAPTFVESERTPNKTTAFRSAAPSITERLAVLRWLKSNGLTVGLPFFNSAGLTPEFVTLYDLTPAETARINQAGRQAKLRLDELAQRHAQLDPTSTDDKLIVTVPAFPTEGGQAYSNLLATFSSVLGNDRYALFNDLSGDILERDLESFGMANSRYEVTLGTQNGNRIYNLNRSFSFENGGGSGTSWTILDAKEVSSILKSFPVLKSYPLPTTLPASSK